MYGDYFDPSNFIVTNASDERGIDFVRELEAHVEAEGNRVRRRIFVLDEVQDSLTPAVQKALRQVMEDSHKTAIFILTANDISPIHKAIRDRCLTFRFKPLTDEEARDKLTQYTFGRKPAGTMVRTVYYVEPSDQRKFETKYRHFRGYTQDRWWPFAETKKQH